MNIYPYMPASELDVITIDTASNPPVSVEIFAADLSSGAGKMVYSAELVPYGGKITLHNMASVFNDALEEAEKCAGSFSIKVDGETLSDLTVTHCDRLCFGLLDDMFLTSLSSQLVDLGARFILAHTRPLKDQGLVLTAIYADDNKHVTEIRRVGKSFSGNSAQFCLDEVKQIMGSGLNPKALIAEEGDRIKTWYLQDFSPDIALYFRNQFNAPEYLPLKAEISRTTHSQANTAVSAGEMIPYDVKGYEEYEVKCFPVSLREADALALAMVSKSCRVKMADRAGDVVFTSQALKIPGSDEERPEVSFSFRFRSKFGGQASMYGEKRPFVFTENFTQSFS